MKNFFKKYLFVFEWIGAAILLAVGIVVVATPDIFLYIAGLVLIIFGLFRLYPLLKTTKDRLMMSIYLVEILLNVVVGVFLVIEGGKDNPSESLLRYTVGGILWLRGLLYFFATVMRKESTDHVKFWTHIGIITLGPIIVFTNFFNQKNLAWILFVFAILSALVIAFDGYKNYKNYRYEWLAKEETKKAIKKKQEAIEEESKEDPLPKKEDVVIPEEEKGEEIRA
ncbi:MAG: hypothetical protein M0R05_07200 [Bacilli bacterium]|nr:hypothetical protein [Bacilli bacterium]MDD4388744.1 hypothetical protein [Bacilli bacterium]